MRSASARHPVRLAANPVPVNNGYRNTHRAGFTLFEIAISLAIMGFAVISVLMVFPLGLKEQQQARARLLAATKTMELIEYFAGKSNSERMAEYETPEPWDTRPFCYTNTRWDLETRLARFDSGIRPLPLDIAKRLDSDSDEIQRLIGEGAYVYYADATIIPGLDIRMRNPAPPGEANKIIFAVNGYAQNNAVPVLPWKAWPYRAGYPSPPLASTFGGSRLLPFNDANVVVASPKGTNFRIVPLEGWLANGAVPPTAAERDPLMLDVFKKAQEYTEAANPHIGPNNPPTVMVLTTKRTALAGSCLAYAQDVFSRINRASDYQTYVEANAATTAAQFQTLGNQWRDAFQARCRNAELAPDGVLNTGREALRTALGQEVQAWRFLANAAAMFYTPKEGEAPPDLSMERMGTIPVSVDRLRYYHDRCQGTVLIIVAGLAALLASLSLTFLTRVRSDVEEGQLQLQLVQARVMLVAACNYIQESSRIGWDIKGYDVAPERGTAERPPNASTGTEHAEAFGWIDVRDGTLGPRISTMDPNLVQPLRGSRPQEANDPSHPTTGSSRFPIGVPVRFDLTVPTVAPYAISMRATYNVVDTAAPDNGRAYLRYPDPQPPFSWNGWAGTRAAPGGTVNDTNLSRWLQGDMTPRAGTAGRCWFRLVREPSGAVFTVTCGAGGTRGFRSWSEVIAEGQQQVFGDQTAFAVMQAQEIRLWYRVEWSPATTVIDMSFLREHEEHTFRVGTPTHAGGNPDNGYSGQQMAPNMGGTIQWIQRLRQEPTIW